jgi:ABC-2 type transport system permease protein
MPRAAPSLLAATGTIAAQGLRRRLRDRSALVRGIVAPVVLAVLIGVALGSTSDFSTTIAVVDADGSPVSRGIVDGLLNGVPADAPVRLVRSDGEPAARRDLQDERVDAVVVLPAGFGASVARADPGATPLALGVVADVRKRISGEIARSLAGGLGARVDAVRLATATALAARGPTDPASGTADVAALAAAAQRLPTTLAVAQQASGDPYRPVAYFGASMAVLFLFFTVGAAASSVISEQREGTLARVRAAPVDDRAILLGKSVTTLVLAFVSLLVMWLVTTFGFGAKWGDPLAVVVVLGATVAAVAGIGSLIAGLARTEQQAMAWTAAISFVLALLGGGFQQPGSLPGFLSRVSLLTPNGWALGALTRIGAADATLTDVLPAVAVLLAMAAVTLTTGIRLLSGRVRA